MISANNDSTATGNVVPQYEALRKAALGGVLPPDARAGMMLFLRRGMGGWSCALATRMTTGLPTGSRPSELESVRGCRTIVHIFAAMAIRASFQGATA